MSYDLEELVLSTSRNPGTDAPSREFGFEPEFRDDDPYVPETRPTTRSVRLYRVYGYEGAFHAHPQADETWRVKVVHVKVGNEESLTRDGRIKVYVYLRLIEKVDRLDGNALIAMLRHGCEQSGLRLRAA